jgi:hypothetical protein
MSHLQYSIISNLKDNNCGYRVIPEIDKAKLYKAPVIGDNILNCLENKNKSKVCPVVICNNDKEQKENEKIYNRNFSNVKLESIPGYRPKFKVCNSYRNLNDIADKHKSHTNKIISDSDVESDMYPGKAPASGYFKNIDIESNLKTLNLHHSKCLTQQYLPKLCEKTIVDNPHLLDRPMCQNYKYANFKEESEFYKYTNKCNDTKQKIRGYTCNEQINDIRQKSLLKFNYEKRAATPCNTGCLPPNEPPLEIAQPLLYGNRVNMLQKPILQIGPERTDHYVENLWNNVSKRRYIYKKHE